MTLSGFASSLNPFIASRHLGFEISRRASVIRVIVILFVRVISVIIGVNLCCLRHVLIIIVSVLYGEVVKSSLFLTP